MICRPHDGGLGTSSEAAWGPASSPVHAGSARCYMLSRCSCSPNSRLVMSVAWESFRMEVMMLTLLLTGRKGSTATRASSGCVWNASTICVDVTCVFGTALGRL